MKEIKCPYVEPRGAYFKELEEYVCEYYCSLNDKFCSREYGGKCETYEDWVKENE